MVLNKLWFLFLWISWPLLTSSAWFCNWNSTKAPLNVFKLWAVWSVRWTGGFYVTTSTTSCFCERISQWPPSTVNFTSPCYNYTWRCLSPVSGDGWLSTTQGYLEGIRCTLQLFLKQFLIFRHPLENIVFKSLSIKTEKSPPVVK